MDVREQADSPAMTTPDWKPFTSFELTGARLRIAMQDAVRAFRALGEAHEHAMRTEIVRRHAERIRRRARMDAAEAFVRDHAEAMEALGGVDNLPASG